MANAMPIMLARIIGAYLLLTAIAVFVLLIITPLIHDGSPDYPFWTYINYFMALGALLMLVLTFLYRRQLDPETTDNYTCAIVNGLFLRLRCPRYVVLLAVLLAAESGQ